MGVNVVCGQGGHAEVLVPLLCVSSGVMPRGQFGLPF